MSTNHPSNLPTPMGTRMLRYGLTALCAGALLALAGCNQAGAKIDRVQTNLVAKSIFQGEWWYDRTAIGVNGDTALLTLDFVFNGEMSWADMGLDKGQSGSIARIRWVIDQNYLFAYRSYETISGGNADGKSPDFRGQPLAVFKILAHVDVKQQYNPVTGETLNVTEENTTDRRWYDRTYMRVDWSQNLVTAFYDYTTVDIDGMGLKRESTPFFFQGGAHSDFPTSWAPQFIRVADDQNYRFASEWPTDQQDAVHYMSFVTRGAHLARDHLFAVRDAVQHGGRVRP